MERNQLLFFMKAAEHEHFTKAAEQLNVSQPYLSNSISALETELGVKLFDRVGRGIRLNDYGRILYRYVEKMQALEKDLILELEDAQHVERKRLVIATNTSLYIPNLMKWLRERIPEAAIQLHLMKYKTIHKQLASGELDFAIIGPSVMGDFEAELIMSDGGIVVYPEGHWLRNYEEIALDELQNETFISTQPGYSVAEVLRDGLTEKQRSMRAYVETFDTNSAIQFVKAGVGLAIAPESAVIIDDFVRQNHARLTDFSSKGTTYLAWRRGQYMDDIARRFTLVVKEYFAKLWEDTRKLSR